VLETVGQPWGICSQRLRRLHVDDAVGAKAHRRLDGSDTDGAEGGQLMNLKSGKVQK
jgi:hypothetical protein